jgi:hypothetical protein
MLILLNTCLGLLVLLLSKIISLSNLSILRVPMMNAESTNSIEMKKAQNATRFQSKVK